MKKLSILAVGTILAACSFSNNLLAQQQQQKAFRKGSLLMSISEGGTFSRYTTRNTNAESDVLHNERIDGERDPLTVEYGLTDHWGIGMNLGTDNLYVDPAKFYGYDMGGNKVKAMMNEVTIDGNYHYYVRRKLDLSAFGSVGLASVTFNGKHGDMNYKYDAGGMMLRAGTRAKYYLRKRFGVMAMLSAFQADCSTKNVKGNTAGQGYDTKITGAALEFGLCFRFLK